MDMDKRTERWAVYLGAAFLLLFAAGQPSDAAIIWSASGSNDGLPVDAQASFTVGTDTVSVVLVNLELNQTSAEQLVTGISFEVGTDGVDTWSSLDFNPGLLGTARSAVAVLGATPTSTIDDVVFDFGAPDGSLGGTCGSNPDSVTIPEPVTIVVWSLLGFLGLAYGYSRRRRR